MPNEQQLAAAFVELADTLVADFDVIDFLDILARRCVAVLGASAAGVVFADQHGRLRVAAASSEDARLLELFELQNDEGPCLDCYRSGRPVVDADLSMQQDRWPRFAPEARAAGFDRVHALPLRLRAEVIGALNIFVRSGDATFSEADARLAQALADVATIGILQERAVLRAATLVEQLQGALNSRVVIEQAKGVVSEQQQCDVVEAFELLRSYARFHRSRLAEVASAVVRGDLTAAELGQRSNSQLD